ncbi:MULTISPECIES: LlaMI family restriction endonuclease [unclassified Pseudoalteromonas]|uniref:LlaMI family restriction endonuclease n=2 Tax=Pseudoalteromonas TaxID=53246 RepID=UPI00110AE8C5|nr:LlaMI family restriction endonuclease [Pseudoalteromonas sp. S1688]TMP45328.1 restriction endonuclease [Pseudoalteromonas sp. S1688]
MDLNKQAIIERFKANVKGRKNEATGNIRHNGRDGHWLEQQMGIAANGNNAPDLLGYEMKNVTTSGKTTFGDWSPDKSLWGSQRVEPSIPKLNKDSEFLEWFGTPNPAKKGRKSWSGAVVPKVGVFNQYGQRLEITANQDIQAVYSFEHDHRPDKHQLIPTYLQKKIVLAQWSKDVIQNKLESKFNDKGWFKCLKDNNGYYNEIVFGSPINYSTWLPLVRTGVVYFDCGMYQTNPRPYCQWRANNTYWDSLITDRYQ